MNSDPFDFEAFDQSERAATRRRLNELTLTALALSATIEDRVAVLEPQVEQLLKSVGPKG